MATASPLCQNSSHGQGVFAVTPQVFGEADSGLSQVSGSDADLDSVPPHVATRCCRRSDAAASAHRLHMRFWAC